MDPINWKIAIKECAPYWRAVIDVGMSTESGDEVRYERHELENSRTPLKTNRALDRLVYGRIRYLVNPGLRPSRTGVSEIDRRLCSVMGMEERELVPPRLLEPVFNITNEAGGGTT